MRDRPGDPVLAEEQRMLPPTTGACSFGGRGYPSWCAEQGGEASRWGSPTPRCPGGIRAAIGGPALPAYGPGPHPRLAYGLHMVVLGGDGRVVLRPGQLLGQDLRSGGGRGGPGGDSAVPAGPSPHPAGWWPGASKGGVAGSIPAGGSTPNQHRPGPAPAPGLLQGRAQPTFRCHITSRQPRTPAGGSWPFQQAPEVVRPTGSGWPHQSWDGLPGYPDQTA